MKIVDEEHYNRYYRLKINRKDNDSTIKKNKDEDYNLRYSR